VINGRCGGIKYNDFHADLQYSFEAGEDEQLNAFYLKAFPTAERIETISYEADPELQLRGVDKVVHFPDGRTVTVDEKKRRKDYGDILLELWKNKERKKLGWLFYSQCDYIVYAVLGSGKIYLLPTLLLQMAWKHNGRQWLKQYDTKLANNHYYNTENIPIPTDVLLAAISAEMKQEAKGA